MALLEQCVKNIVEMFVDHADGDGKLSKDEFKKLVEVEIQNPEIKAKLCTAGCDKVFGRADDDGDLEFREFLKCVAFMCKCYYCKKTGKSESCDQGKDK